MRSGSSTSLASAIRGLCLQCMDTAREIFSTRWPPSSPSLTTTARRRPPAINVAIIGRPNAGKSSLTNRLTDNDRSHRQRCAGTARDAIDTLVEHDGEIYRIVDTAGLRRKSQIDEDVEYYGFVRAMRAIDRADVALLVIDGTLAASPTKISAWRATPPSADAPWPSS